jgi:hypothetical protein
MSTDVDGTTQGETHKQETKHWDWAGLWKRCKIGVDGTTHGETREQEMEHWDWARVERHCEMDNVPAYEASVKYNRL